MNWILKRPELGDTVKVELSLPDEIIIGVMVTLPNNGNYIIDCGDRRRHISYVCRFLCLG